MEENGYIAGLPYGYCGMMCALCSRYRTEGKSRCAGCSHGGYYTEPCKIVKCCKETAARHCGLCKGYPCDSIRRMADFSDLDTDGSFRKVCGRVRENGFDAWYEEYRERAELLTAALERYNNGRMKRFLCELLMREDLAALRAIMRRAETLTGTRREVAEGFKRVAGEAAAKQL